MPAWSCCARESNKSQGDVDASDGRAGVGRVQLGSVIVLALISDQFAGYTHVRALALLSLSLSLSLSLFLFGSWRRVVFREETRDGKVRRRTGRRWGSDGGEKTRWKGRMKIVAGNKGLSFTFAVRRGWETFMRIQFITERTLVVPRKLSCYSIVM
jgi:hypothetical protein